MRGCIPDAAKICGIPSGTIRRWLAEGRLVRYGDHKPWRVDYDEIMALRALLTKGEAVSEVEVLWAMDICTEINHPYYGNPIAAHQIIRTEGDPGIHETRVTACGKRLTQSNHPQGWWSFPPGKLPLAAHAVHCMEGEQG